MVEKKFDSILCVKPLVAFLLITDEAHPIGFTINRERIVNRIHRIKINQLFIFLKKKPALECVY